MIVTIVSFSVMIKFPMKSKSPVLIVILTINSSSSSKEKSSLTKINTVEDVVKLSKKTT